MRYALYFTPPPDSLLWQAGAEWLGRDPFPTATPPHQPDVPGIMAERFHALTEAPRRYGFHGTLKAPFRLAPSQDPNALMSALDSFCSLRRPFVVEDVAPRSISHGRSRFLALAPSGYHQGLADLAADCVQAFDVFRAPLTEAEIERRLKSGLSDRQRALLHQWGYPFVMEEFRFHMTLTGPINPSDLAPVKDSAVHHFTDALRQDVLVDAISLFIEEQPGGEFRFIRRYMLG